MHLTEWDCEWEQCVSYPLTSVRVTVQHQQQSEVCAIHTSVLLYSGYTQQSMHDSQKSQSVWCERMPRSYLSPLDVVVILPGTCAMSRTQLCFMLAGSRQADVVQTCSNLFGEQLFCVDLFGAMRSLCQWFVVRSL